MSQFRKMNIIGGWLVFAVAFVTYLLTLEPTVSFWDCGEFIATSYKLQVGHPPGTPFFFLINRLGAMFAPTPADVAAIINGLSALESALTIAFLFWSISHLARRIYQRKGEELAPGQNWAVIGAAAIGSLAYTFTDTFWFSAVEAEVYAISSLFTAIVFWAILKWEEVADQPGSNRWLVLIAYLMGLSIGAHILNLLAIPALVFVYYFKKFPGRKKSELWKPALASIVALSAFYIITPTVVSVGAFVDRIFVNSFGLPFNSGMAFFMILLLIAIGYGIYRTHKAGRALWNTILVSTALVVIGFSTYGIVLIRASVNPPMNSNDPNNPYALSSFLSREQYGSRPLLYGETYATPPIDTELGTSFYQDNGKYVPYEKVTGYEYDPAGKMLFPRMYSSSHAEQYKSWGDVTGRKTRMQNGEMVTLPTFGENLRFFFSYQLNYMYWRYFLWNFVGRQNDIQGNGGILYGNWDSGISAIDDLHNAPHKGMPDELANNRGRNHYYFLPFILGLMGLLFQLQRDGRNFLVVALLFFMTGLAIILYLNQTPSQPRERDYAYVGSFYAFAIWIGIGLLPIFEFIGRWIKSHKAAAVASVLICSSVPVILAVENWDDHDRSGRTLARDIGFNYLHSTLPNSIIVDYGDNDTFPIWYAQEVEGFRTDVRVMNSSYLGGAWYVDQMRIKANESAPLPITLPRHKYIGGAPGIFHIQEIPKPGGGEWTGKEVMAVVNSDNPNTQFKDNSGNAYDFIPARRIAIPVNKENVLASGIVRPEDAHLIEDTIFINLKQKNYLLLDDMILLDILSNNDWTRPIHFTSAVGVQNFGLINVNEGWSYLQQDGAAYRLIPIKSPLSEGIGRIDTEVLYDNLMNNFRYGGFDNPRVYLDYFADYTLNAVQFRSTFARLAKQLVQEGDTTRAVEVLDRAMKVFPPSQLRYDIGMANIIEAYWMAGQQEKGDKLADEMTAAMIQYLNYFTGMTGRKAESVENDYYEKLSFLYRLYMGAKNTGNTERANQIMNLFPAEK